MSISERLRQVMAEGAAVLVRTLRAAVKAMKVCADGKGIQSQSVCSTSNILFRRRASRSASRALLTMQVNCCGLTNVIPRHNDTMCRSVYHCSFPWYLERYMGPLLISEGAAVAAVDSLVCLTRRTRPIMCYLVSRYRGGSCANAFLSAVCAGAVHATHSSGAPRHPPARLLAHSACMRGMPARAAMPQMLFTP